MIQLDAGNVLLKPSQRKQLLSWLRRSLRLGQRLGDFVLKISLHRIGRAFEVVASVHDRRGDFSFRARQSQMRYALRDCVRMLTQRLQLQRFGALA